MRVKLELDIADVSKIKNQLIQWANQFKHVVWLDSNFYPDREKTYEAILAVDADSIFQSDSPEALNELKEYRKINKDWLFGYVSFDAGESIPPGQKANEKKDDLQFSKLNFFHPRKIFFLKKDSIEIHYKTDNEKDIQVDWKAINDLKVQEDLQTKPNLQFQSRLSKQEYLDKIKKIQEYIEHGKVTEINFCQDFYTHEKLENPLAVYKQLNEISKTPFASYVRMEEKYVLCASPERYLSNTNGVLKSQPIKGTAKRKENILEDSKIRLSLETDEKEITENVIITEMVVDEMYAIAQEGSVQITELCKAYSFKQVHQLISTVICHLKPELHAVDAIQATYPMGSMTGIPKESTLKIIEELEDFNRGLYSGSIGYFAPNDDFDFNVVIRSILYNAQNEYISFAAGGAITALSNPENEYEEVRLKVKAMEQVLGAIVDK